MKLKQAVTLQDMSLPRRIEEKRLEKAVLIDSELNENESP